MVLSWGRGPEGTANERNPGRRWQMLAVGRSTERNLTAPPETSRMSQAHQRGEPTDERLRQPVVPEEQHGSNTRQDRQPGNHRTQVAVPHRLNAAPSKVWRGMCACVVCARSGWGRTKASPPPGGQGAATGRGPWQGTCPSWCTYVVACEPLSPRGLETV